MKAPQFQLQNVYTDGRIEEPQLYEITDVDTDWQMARRGFLATSAVAISLLSGCSSTLPKVAPPTQDEPEVPLQNIKAHSSSIRDIAINPDGNLMASQDAHVVKIWEMPGGKLLYTYNGALSAVASLCFSPDNTLLAMTVTEKKGDALIDFVNLLTVSTGKLRHSLSSFSAMIYSIAFSPDGKFLAAGNKEGTLFLWAVSSGELLHSVSDNADLIVSLAFSPDGKLLASGDLHGRVVLREVPSGAVVQTLTDHAERTVTGYTNGVISLAFSPDSTLLASGAADKTVVLYEIPSGKTLHTFAGYSHTVSVLLFTSDTKLLAASEGDNHTILLWEMPSIQIMRTLNEGTDSRGSVEGSRKLEGHTENISSLHFSPDGTFLISGGQDQTIKLWDVVSGKLVTALFDPVTLEREKKVTQYALSDQKREAVTHTVSCNEAIPAGAICTCHCVTGAMPRVLPTSSGSIGSGICSCIPVCTCVPIK